jgi:hypothetical protein
MKFALILAFSFLSVNSFANMHGDKDWDKLTFEEQKKMKLEGLGKHTALINETTACVNKSKDKEGLSSCQKQMDDKHAAMKDGWSKTKKQSQEDMAY